MFGSSKIVGYHVSVGKKMDSLDLREHVRYKLNPGHEINDLNEIQITGVLVRLAGGTRKPRPGQDHTQLAWLYFGDNHLASEQRLVLPEERLTHGIYRAGWVDERPSVHADLLTWLDDQGGFYHQFMEHRIGMSTTVELELTIRYKTPSRWLRKLRNLFTAKPYVGVPA